MRREEVLPYLHRRLQDVVPTGMPEPLSGGLLNVVWRVPGAPSLIVKWAPPYLAAAPDVPLDPARIGFEVRSLEVLGPGGALAQVAGAAVRPPRLLDYDADRHVAVMEDLGTLPHLGEWLRSGQPTAGLGARLGAFIGRLHRESFERSELVRAFDNRAVQETRLAVQYRGIEAALQRAGVPEAAALGREAEALGERLLAPGHCLLMGDLWPPSVLVAADGLRVIDWEFAHFGNPAQDVAHLAAHLWMHVHRAPNEAVAAEARAAQRQFLSAYQAAVAPARDRLWMPQVQRDAAIHYGAEILVRVVGPFQAGYLYDGLPPEAPAVQEAVREAVRHLRGSGAPTF